MGEAHANSKAVNVNNPDNGVAHSEGGAGHADVTPQSRWDDDKASSKAKKGLPVKKRRAGREIARRVDENHGSVAQETSKQPLPRNIANVHAKCLLSRRGEHNESKDGVVNSSPEGESVEERSSRHLKTLAGGCKLKHLEMFPSGEARERPRECT